MTGREFGSRLRACIPRGAGSITITATLLIGGMIFVLRTLDIEPIVRTAKQSDPRLLAIAVAVYAISWPIRGQRYADILRPMGHTCGRGFLTATIFVSQFANLLVPARAGDGARAYLINKRDAVPYAIGAGSLAVERAFDLVAITLLGGIALGWLVLTGWSVTTASAFSGIVPILLGVGVSAVAVSTVAVTVARAEPVIATAARSRWADTRWSGIVEAAVRCGDGVRAVAAAPRAMARICLGSVIIWGVDILTAIIVLMAVVSGGDSGLSAWSALGVGTLAVSAGNMAKTLPLTHGGIGLYEAAFAGVLAGIAPVTVGTAVVVAVFDHTLKNLVTLLGGGPTALILGISPLVTARDNSESPDHTGTPRTR